MNAIAAPGASQASMMAAFTLLAANTGPSAVPATPAFLNMIGLMLSSPSLKAPAAKTTAASPVQIADAMIRSMLGSPLPAALANSTLALGTTLNQTVPVSMASNVRPVSTVPADSNQPAPRKEGATAPGTPMPIMVANVPVQAIVVSAPLPAAGNSKETVAAAAMPQAPSSAPSALPVKSSPDMKTAFTAILTPLKETQAASGSQIAPASEPVTGASDSAAMALSVAAQPAAVQNSQPQAESPAAETQATADAQADGDTPSQQGNDSPKTPVRPIAPASEAKIKPAVQQDDNALQAAATSAVHDRSIESFTPAPPADSTRAATASSAGAPAATPYNATAEALRTTESNLTAAPLLRTGAAQEISIRIAPPDSPAVDLRVVERSGQVHVDVRTSDGAMQTSLRQDLGTLTNSLERAGYHTETFTPSSTLSRASSSAQTDHQQDPSQNRGGAGDFSGGRRQQQQQKRPGTWLEEFEEQP